MRTKSFVRYALLGLATLFATSPYIWIFITSIKPRDLAYRPSVIEFQPTLDAYVSVFANNPFVGYYLNTIVVSIVPTVISLLVGIFAAYALSRYDSRVTTSKYLFISSFVFPPIIFVVPMFFIFDMMGLTNTLAGVVISHMTFAMPLSIWFLTDFFDNLPPELEEAAMIDGDSRYTAIVNILIPNIKGGIIAAGLLSFVLSWNSFLYPLILAGAESKTLPVAVAEFNTFQGLLISRMSAAIILTIAPVTILAFYSQKYLVKGLSESGIKG